MSKFVELSDVKRTLLEMSKERTRSVGWGDVLMERLKDSSIDIVHCKDCIRFDGEDCCERIGMILYPEDVERHFCGYGEREDNE